MIKVDKHSWFDTKCIVSYHSKNSSVTYNHYVYHNSELHLLKHMLKKIL